VSGVALRRIERELADQASEGHASMDSAFGRFEQTQPELAARINDVLDRPLDETALALGYFLSIAIWMAFEQTFSARLAEVTTDAWRATSDALALEEDLRKKHADEPLDLDDVLALEQPDVVAFVHEHVEAALETTLAPASESPSGFAAVAGEALFATESADVDVDDIHLVYRTILALTLALSHAVAPEGGETSAELLA
jgi:hypothetical protein